MMIGEGPEPWSTFVRLVGGLSWGPLDTPPRVATRGIGFLISDYPE